SYIDCKYFILSVALFISCVPIRFDIYSTTINECGCALSLGPVKSIIPSILFEYGSTIGAAEQIQGCTPSQKCSYEKILIGCFVASVDPIALLPVIFSFHSSSIVTLIFFVA